MYIVLLLVVKTSLVGVGAKVNETMSSEEFIVQGAWLWKCFYILKMAEWQNTKILRGCLPPLTLDQQT